MNYQQAQMSSLVDIDWRITLWNRMLDEAHQTEDTRREADLLFQQNQLLTEIKNRMEDKKSKCQMTESDDTESTLNKSMRSLYRPILTSRKSMADITGFPQSRSRFSSNITTDHIRLRRKVAPSTDQVEDMLEEVRLKCNFDTYETASWMVQNIKELGRKLTEYDDDSYQLERERKAHQQSRAQLQQLQKKLNEATKRLKILEDFVGSKEAAERDRKNSHANLQEREKILMRSQASVVIKEKLLSENSKKQNAKMAFLQKMQRQYREERQMLDDMWQRLVHQADNDTKNQFYTQVYNKCRQSLLRQRKVLAEQESDLEKRQTAMAKLAQQLETVTIA